jgi:hypothetical protein
MRASSFVVVTAAIVTACSKTAAPEPAPPATATPTAAAAAPATPTATPNATPNANAKGPDEVAWDAPASWPSVPTNNPLRKATYKIPRAPGDTEDAELTISTAQGGVAPNVQRWSAQFFDAPAKQATRKVNGLDVTTVEIEGPFRGGGPMTMGGAGSAPKDHQMLLGAIVDAGDKQHFFKLVGPEKTVKAARKDFDAFVASLRAK